MYCIALHCIALHCIALRCIALHCIVLLRYVIAYKIIYEPSCSTQQQNPCDTPLPTPLARPALRDRPCETRLARPQKLFVRPHEFFEPRPVNCNSPYFPFLVLCILLIYNVKFYPLGFRPCEELLQGSSLGDVGAADLSRVDRLTDGRLVTLDKKPLNMQRPDRRVLYLISLEQTCISHANL